MVMTIEKFLILLFGAIIAGIIFTNPGGVRAVFDGFANFASKTTEAFAGGSGGFAARSL